MSDVKENSLSKQNSESENTEVAPDLLRPQKLLETAFHCLDSGLYTDVTFIVGDKRFPAHRLVMASISDYFESLFKIDEKVNGEVNLSSVSPEDFLFLLNFAYTGQVDITKDNVQDILIAADYFRDWNLRKIDLEDGILKFLRENLDGISQTQGFSTLDRDMLCQLFQDDHLVLWNNKVLLKSIGREKLVFNAVLRYISSQDNLEDEVVETLVKAVRLLELPQSVIDECLRNFEDLIDNKVINGVVKLREKAVKFLNKRARDVSLPKDSIIDVQDVPNAWFRPRQLPNYIISNGRRRYASGGEFGRCTSLPIFSIIDPNHEIHRIDIWSRQWDGHFVIGGLKLSYRNSGTYKECTRGDCHSIGEHYFVELEPDEFIVKVNIGSGTLIDRLGFETNSGRICGPFGGVGGGKHTEKAPDGSFSYLYDINCDSVTTQGSDAVHNLLLRWITFQ
ncbi:hypothetical protein Btru_004127 [Bulinus truncatus]|nr:hypothetical protein Btru_004127 [Bulinus truncatus]